MRLYHFVSGDYGLEDIKKRRLKIAQIDQLNDPFEFLAFSSSSRKMRAAIDGWKKKMAISHGLLCFSDKWSEPVQWSHYADRHRGLCLGFDVQDAVTQKVVYSDERAEPNLNAILSPNEEDGKEEIARSIFSKSTSWSYESEWRIFTELDEPDPDNALYFHEFSDQLRLREVIVGSLSTITRAQVRAAVGDLPEVSAFKARLAFQSFDIVRQKNSSMWK